MPSLKSNQEGFFESKKSKFYSFVFLVDSEKEIKDRLQELQKKYKDARHIVYAYRMEEEGVLREKFQNDKEPTGSAGKPLLYLLQKKELNNCLLVVIRYFGGTKLGVGGLARAYTASALESLKDNIK